MNDGYIRRRDALQALAAAAALAALGETAAAAENQPHMEKAMALLQQALGELKDATADKGGHRAKAVGLVESAIAEVKDGIKFDNKS